MSSCRMLRASGQSAEDRLQSKSDALGIVINLCVSEWTHQSLQNVLPPSASQRASDALKPGNVFVLSALELLHCLYTRQTSPPAVPGQQPWGETSERQTLPPEVLRVARAWTANSHARRFEAYLQLEADSELLTQTCDFFNAQREAHFSKSSAASDAAAESPSFAASPEELKWHLRKVALRALLEWVADAEAQPSAMECLDAAVQANLVLPFLDDFKESATEGAAAEEVSERRAILEAARLVRALVLNVCSGVKSLVGVLPNRQQTETQKLAARTDAQEGL